MHQFKKILFIVSQVLLVSCSQDLGPVSNFFQSGLREDNGGVLDPARLEEAQTNVAEHKSVIDKLMLETAWNGDALRYLGDEYFRRDMFAPALTAYAQALQIIPTSFSLWYRSGLAHAQLATLELDPDARKARSMMAARAYEKALSFEPDHGSSLYGLGILYVFELGEPAKALVPLDRLLEKETQNTRAYFVRARARFEVGDIEGAIRDYDAIIQYSKDSAEKEKARRNRSEVLGGVS